MKKILYLKTFMAFCLTVSMGILVQSCDEGDSEGSQVALLSFGPSGVRHGETIRFVGRNLDKATSIVLFPSIEVGSDAFTSQSKELIELVVPQAAETGKVILRSPQGDIESKTMLSFDVEVSVSSITEEAKPGTNITITGEKVNWIESITFPKNQVVEKEFFVSRSETELVVTVPMAAQSGILTFVTGGTDPLEFDAETALTVHLPTVVNVTPLLIDHTEELTITGTDLNLVAEIAFPGGASVLSQDFVSQSETTIVVAVPATSLAGKLVLSAFSGLTVETAGEITIRLPNVVEFSPSSTDEHTAGSTLTLKGTNLDLVQKLAFPNVITPVENFVSRSDEEIQVVIPESVQGGTLVITTIHGFTVPIDVPFGDQLELTVVFYDDAIKGFSAWGGWGSTTDWANAEQVRIGTKAIKVTYTGDNWSGGGQFADASVSTAGTAFLSFSVYGGEGTDAKTLQVLVKRAGGESTKQVTIKEGEWTDFKIPLSELGSPAAITEMFFQNVDFTGTVYIDQVGLR